MHEDNATTSYTMYMYYIESHIQQYFGLDQVTLIDAFIIELLELFSPWVVNESSNTFNLFMTIFFVVKWHEYLDKIPKNFASFVRLFQMYFLYKNAISNLNIKL